MDFLEGGVRAYLLAAVFFSMIPLVWGANRFVLGNTTGATGWTLIVAVAALLTGTGSLIRYFRSPSERADPSDDYRWHSR